MRERRHQLTERRQAQGLSQEALAERVGVSSNTVARWERGEVTPLANQRRALAEALDVSLSRLDRILKNEDDEDNGAESVCRLVPAWWLSAYVSMEQGAARIEAYEPYVVDGLLQTSDYARVLGEHSDHVHGDGERLERFVELRMTRQAALTRQDNPLELAVILSEGALRLKVGDRQTMHAQLEHLAAMAERPNITVNILPFASGPHSATRGKFAFLSFPWETGTNPSTLYLESYSGPTYVESQPEIDRFVALYQRLYAMSLSPDESIDFIHRIAKEHNGD